MNTELPVDEHQEDDDAASFRDKIVHVLTLYPVISPTMLQMGLGPSTKPKLWRPDLQMLIDEGIVLQETVSKQTPSGQYRQYQRLSLNAGMLKDEIQKITG